MTARKYFSFLHVLVFSVFFMTLFFTGCSDGSSDDAQSSSTADETYTINDKSYVPAELSGNFGTILSNCMANKTSAYDSDCVNYFVTDDLLKNDTSLTNFKLMIKHLLSGKTVIFVAPTYGALRAVDFGLSIVSGYSFDEFEKMLPDIEIFSNDAYSYLCAIASSTDTFFSSSVENKGDNPVFEAVAIRGPEIRYIENIETAIKDADSEMQVTDEHYRLFLSSFVTWLNNYSTSRDARDELYSMGNTRVANVSKTNEIDKLESAKRVTWSYIAFAPSKNPNEVESMPVDVTINYWSFTKHSENGNSDTDYLVFENEIDWNNQKLGCNTDQDEDCWYPKYGYSEIYGPYFVKSTAQFTLDGVVPTTHSPSPQTDNNVTYYTSSSSFSLSGNLGFSNSGVGFGVSVGVGWSNSTTIKRNEIATIYTDDTKTGGPLKWVWTATNLPAPKSYTRSHYSVSETLRSKLIIRPNWYWQINNAQTNDSYSLKVNLKTGVGLYFPSRFSSTYVGPDYERGDDYNLIRNTNDQQRIIKILAPTRFSKTVNLVVDWPDKENAEQSEINYINSILSEVVALYSQTYTVATHHNTDTEIQVQVKSLSEKLKAQISAQKKALRQKNFNKLGKCTFSFQYSNENNESITCFSFPVDFSDY